MTFASKTTYNLNNLKILRSKVTKNLWKSCEFPPRGLPPIMNVDVAQPIVPKTKALH